MVYNVNPGKICRAHGRNLFNSDKYQKVLNRKPGAPGAHGGKRRGKVSDYGKQLKEKQLLKRTFCLSEKQFRRYFDKASRSQEVTGEVLFSLLERRLDNVLYRAGFALTRMQSRQFATHGLFLVNGRRVDIPSYQVSTGDIIEIRSKSKTSSVFAKNGEENESHTAPAWLKSNMKNLKVEVLDMPGTDSFETGIDTQLIVEFYSR